MKVTDERCSCIGVFCVGFLFLEKIKCFIEFTAQNEGGSFVCQSYKTHSLTLFPHNGILNGERKKRKKLNVYSSLDAS